MASDTYPKEEKKQILTNNLCQKNSFFKNPFSSQFFDLDIKTLPVANLQEEWYLIHDMKIHRKLYECGIVVIKETNVDETSESDIEDVDDHFEEDITRFISKNSFPLKNRRFTLYELANGNNLGIDHVAKLSRIKATYDILKLLIDHENVLPFEKCIAVVNDLGRKEVFLPFKFTSSRAAYASFRLPQKNNKTFSLGNIIKNNKNSEFAGCKQFVTAGCIGGGSIIGIDSNDNPLHFIKKNIGFYEKQYLKNIKFTSINYSSYEQTLFFDLEKLVSIIDILADKSSKKLYYHLPYFDYMLFGVQLYIQGKMTQDTLEQFIKAVLSRKEEHIKKINSICEQHKIEVTIESPFVSLCSLFLARYKELEKESNTKNINAKAILSILSLSTENIHPKVKHQMSCEELKEQERQLVFYCIEKLTCETTNLKHYYIWQDFLAITGKQNVTTFEDLFKMANAIVIAMASEGRKAYETCSIVPISEKQIQVSYEEYANKAKKGGYPQAIQVTLMESIVSFCSNNNKGLLFYADIYQKAISSLITDKDLLYHSQQNLLAHIEGRPQDIVAIDQILPLAAKNIIEQEANLRVKKI